MSTKTLTPREFSDALVAVVPEKLIPKIRTIYFDVATQLHEAVTVETPVDTGYLRAGFQATTGDEQPATLGPRDRKGSYEPELDGESASSMAAAAKNLEPLTMGFVAPYAAYVEDKRHMVAQARGQFPLMVETALRNASEEG